MITIFFANVNILNKLTRYFNNVIEKYTKNDLIKTRLIRFLRKN